MDKAIQVLRSGGVILVDDGTFSYLCGDVKSEQALLGTKTILGELEGKAGLDFSILISDVIQLRDYVQIVPDLAWDIVEFSEVPLEVIYPTGRNLNLELLGEDGSVKVRLIKDKDFQKLLYKFGRGVFCGKLPANYDKTVLLKKVDFELKVNRSTENAKGKTLRLELNGEIKFIN